MDTRCPERLDQCIFHECTVAYNSYSCKENYNGSHVYCMQLSCHCDICFNAARWIKQETIQLSLANWKNVGYNCESLPIVSFQTMDINYNLEAIIDDISTDQKYLKEMTPSIKKGSCSAIVVTQIDFQVDLPTADGLPPPT